jgi:hypothetical protein
MAGSGYAVIVNRRRVGERREIARQRFVFAQQADVLKRLHHHIDALRTAGSWPGGAEAEIAQMTDDVTVDLLAG